MRLSDLKQLNKIGIHTETNKQKAERKALPYSRMSTNKCKRNAANKDSPFGSPQYDG